MNIFSQENFNGVQEVIKSVTQQNAPSPAKEPVVDEMEYLNQQSQRIQELIEQIDALPDQNAREMMQECIQEILSFYGHGLKRILGLISKEGNATPAAIYNNLIDDSFVSGLLLIHDLHPLDLKTRLHQALTKVKPYMDSHGGSVEIVSLENGSAKLKLSGSCDGCPSSSVTLELGIKQAVEELCPDLVSLEVEGIATSAKNGSSSNHTEIGWKVLKGLNELPDGAMTAVEIPGVSLLVCRVNKTLYAYRNLCPACDRSFSNGKLEGDILKCQLGHSFNVQHAGICPDDAEIHLDPFPLLEDANSVKVSVG